jgi:hypothetical protein
MNLKWFGLSIILIASTVSAFEWDSSNNPFRLDEKFKTKFSSLPLEGSILDTQFAWPANHWANYLGGIAHRWSSSNPQNFSYKPYQLSDLKKLEAHEIEQLSPAEKFDIFNGNYHYPTVYRVWGQTSPYEVEWNGICHGVAPATLNHEEPQTVTLKNSDGIEVTFYSSDVAALMSYYYAKYAESSAILIGKRCNAFEREGQTWYGQRCDDLNAGAFHIILTNKLGLSKKSFIADIDRFNEVWNHVAVDYKIDIYSELPPNENSAYGTFKRYYVEATVKYAGAISPKFDAVLGTENAEYVSQTYVYYIEVDKNDNIIGGEWESNLRPDFVWVQDQAEFHGTWSVLMKKIYKTKSDITPIVPINENLDIEPDAD